MRRITVVDGHPDPSRARLIHALSDRYVQTAQAAGLEVRRIDVASIDFPLLRTASDFFDGAAPESLRQAQRDIAWADHLVFFYPLWLGTMPALFKAFIEQIFRPGFATAFGGPLQLPKQLFRGKSARVVVTMGMPAFIYRISFGDYGVKSFERSVLGLCGIAPVTETLLGGAGAEGECRARKWLGLMSDFAERDAHPEVGQRRELLRGTLRAVAVLGLSYAAFVLVSSRSKAWIGKPPATFPAPPGSSELDERLAIR
jgi:putative NADPH-quinone reductase